MRPTLLLCALALAACDDSPQDVFENPSDMSICTTSCNQCEPGRICVVGTGQGAPTPVPFPTTCLQPCRSSADCASRTCVDILGAEPAGSYCVGPYEPGACTVKCTMAPTLIACDGDVLVRPYIADVCGLERIYCPSVCSRDGGSSSASCP